MKSCLIQLKHESIQKPSSSEHSKGVLIKSFSLVVRKLLVIVKKRIYAQNIRAQKDCSVKMLKTTSP